MGLGQVVVAGHQRVQVHILAGPSKELVGHRAGKERAPLGRGRNQGLGCIAGKAVRTHEEPEGPAGHCWAGS